MYQKEEVERLAKKYVEIDSSCFGLYCALKPQYMSQIFEALIKALEPLINVQLGKNYSSLKEFWDDLRQEVLLRIYKNRGGLSVTKSKSLYVYFYNRIRDYLSQAADIVQGRRKKKKIKMGYDRQNLDVDYFEDLSMRKKKKLGIEPIEEENYD